MKQIQQAAGVDLARQEASGAARDTAEALAYVRDLEVSEVGFEGCARMARTIKERKKELVALRQRWTGPLKAVVRDLESFFRGPIQGLDEAERILKGKLLEARKAEAEAKAQALAKAAKAVQALDRAGAETALATAASVPTSTAQGLQVRKVWKGEADRAALPREYLIPDTAALLALTRKLGKDPGIPGWKAWQEETIAIGGAK